jgi:hypothetical protein
MSVTDRCRDPIARDGHTFLRNQHEIAISRQLDSRERAFRNLFGGREQRHWHIEADSARRLQVDDEFELGSRIIGRSAGFSPLRIRQWAAETMSVRLGSTASEQQVHWWTEVMGKTNPRAALATCSARNVMDLDERLSRITAPTLIVTHCALRNPCRHGHDPMRSFTFSRCAGHPRG